MRGLAGDRKLVDRLERYRARLLGQGRKVSPVLETAIDEARAAAHHIGRAPKDGCSGEAGDEKGTGSRDC